jgi:hypothetical protein
VKISLDEVADGVAFDGRNRSEVIAALVRGAAAQGRLIAALLASSESAPPGSSAVPDRLLTAKQAATILNVSTNWLYRRPNLSFSTRIGSRWRYSERRLKNFIANRQGVPNNGAP